MSLFDRIKERLKGERSVADGSVDSQKEPGHSKQEDGVSVTSLESITIREFKGVIGIVEDDESLAISIGGLLRQAGYEVRYVLVDRQMNHKVYERVVSEVEKAVTGEGYPGERPANLMIVDINLFKPGRLSAEVVDTLLQHEPSASYALFRMPTGLAMVDIIREINERNLESATVIAVHTGYLDKSADEMERDGLDSALNIAHAVDQLRKGSHDPRLIIDPIAKGDPINFLSRVPGLVNTSKGCRQDYLAELEAADLGVIGFATILTEGEDVEGEDVVIDDLSQATVDPWVLKELQKQSQSIRAQTAKILTWRKAMVEGKDDISAKDAYALAKVYTSLVSVLEKGKAGGEETAVDLVEGVDGISDPWVVSVLESYISALEDVNGTTNSWEALADVDETVPVRDALRFAEVYHCLVATLEQGPYSAEELGEDLQREFKSIVARGLNWDVVKKGAELDVSVPNGFTVSPILRSGITVNERGSSGVAALVREVAQELQHYLKLSSVSGGDSAGDASPEGLLKFSCGIHTVDDYKKLLAAEQRKALGFGSVVYPTVRGEADDFGCRPLEELDEENPIPTRAVSSFEESFGVTTTSFKDGSKVRDNDTALVLDIEDKSGVLSELYKDEKFRVFSAGVENRLAQFGGHANIIPTSERNVRIEFYLQNRAEEIQEKY